MSWGIFFHGVFLNLTGIVYNIGQESVRGLYLFSLSGPNSRARCTVTKRNEIQQTGT